MHTDKTPRIETRLAELFREIVGLGSDFSAAELSSEARLDLDLELAVWRALGYPEPEPDAKLFDSSDVESMKGMRALLDLGISREDLLALARVYGQVFSRLAEAEQRVYNRQFIEPLVRQGLDAEQIGEQLRPISIAILPLLDQLLINAHRRALDVTIRQVLVSTSGSVTEPYAVAIVDLVDYSGLSARVDASELSRCLARFEEVIMRRCAEGGTRLVKMIGDAALFVSPHADHSVETAKSILRDIGDLPTEARVGIDYGDVLPLEGDYFGHPVNIAARITSVAEPSTITVSRALLDALPDEGSATAIGVRMLKGVGDIELFVIAS